MMTALDHPLVVEYLHRLAAESARLPADQAAELQRDIREHLAAALGNDPSEPSIREGIDRLGMPAELVDAAGGAPSHQDGAPDTNRRSGSDDGNGGVELAALVLLLGAGVFFILWPLALLMWAVGLVLVFRSQRWDVGEKLRAALVVGLTMPLTVMVLGLAGASAWTQACSPSSGGQVQCPESGIPAWGIVIILLLVAYLVYLVWTVVRLARAARRSR
ncbi:MAG: hypothetical protein Q4P07_01285 [Ornithinimicrobium sp.]|uniref:HAAS signaling domain-containing protein n=1 Tax=Ornithinimicrobium sp. TaxID=1977084 RepID=UPI0026DED051|nr:hypothetical protein [Ornithinimicrobium sp.]MDO5738764.1 hypothetical protein [Ornithinimicrobium sp.]